MDMGKTERQKVVKCFDSAAVLEYLLCYRFQILNANI
jgi:hypothetical protein